MKEAVTRRDWLALSGLAVGAMAGDLVSSFMKRRLRLKSEAQAVGLDQIPEVLLPLLLRKSRLGLSGICCKVGGRLRKRRGRSQIRPRSRTGSRRRRPEPASRPHQCSEPVPF